MKKLSRIILISLGGLILLILVLLFTVPLLFKDKIRAKVEQVINESVNAKVNFDAYKLGFFKDFPNLSFSLDNVSVVGTDKFANDTLAGFKSFNLVFNLGSLFSNAGYEVKSIIVDQALVNAIYLEDGSANWDIAKETEEKPDQEAASGSSEIKILLKKVSLLNSSISYIDKSSDMELYLNDLNFDLKGDMTMSETDMQITMNAGDATFIMEGTKYLNKAVADSKIDLLADLDGMKFTLRDNYVEINDLRLNFSGMVAMPGDDIETDLSFGTEQTSFKTILSLIPAIYMKDFEGLRTSGEFELSGSAKGVYSDADSTLPDIALDLKIKDGLISYPDLPERISNIRLDSRLFADGKDPDMTLVNIDAFHMELAGNPFDLTFALRTPLSDPDFSGSMVGKLDLTALSKAVPLDSISLSGLIDMSVRMAGRLSMIENQQYDKFQASGKMDVNNMEVTMTGYPGIKIDEAGFEFSPAYAALTKSDLMVGEKSDFSISGRLENYIPYLFKNETLKGKLTLRSKMLDASDILSKIAADTTAIDDTTSLAIIRIPNNIDFDFNALINNLKYDKISANDLKGHIIVRDGVLSIRETGMSILGGIVAMNADYDTRDTLKPLLRTDFDIKSFAVKDAFNTFSTIQKLAPAAQGIDGKVNVKFTFESLLGSDWMPVIPSISGSGKLQSDEVTLLTAVAYDQMKKVLKLSDSYSNTFKDINVSFNINEGRIYVQPFDTRVGNIKMNISGDQGIDQTLNYIVKTEIPRSELGSSLNSAIETLSTQAAAFGFAFKPADVLKVNVRITGVFGRPVVTPVFGSTSGESSSGSQSTVRETAKQVVGDAVDTSKERLRKEAEARGDELIREAEAKAQLMRDEAAKAAETIRKEADAQAQRLITEASTKGTVAKLAAQRAADTLKKEADKRADQLVSEADSRANQLIEEARTKKQEMIDSF